MEIKDAAFKKIQKAFWMVYFQFTLIAARILFSLYNLNQVFIIK